jgi:hypothetical protein
LCRLKAEALVTMGRTNDVLGYLRQAMSKVGMTRPDITLIRLSLQDSTQLPEFEKLVAELVASRQITESVGLLENAWACREVENFERAIMFAKSLVLLQATTDYFNVKLGSAEIPNPAGNWIDDAKIALADLKRDLDRFGVEFFLISGTLLGCHREGTLLGHDKDIDVGIMQGPDPAALKRHLTSTGRFRPMPSKEPALIKLRHINDTNIDVFVHWSENDRLIHRGNLVSWWNTPFKLQPVEFLGAPYLVPQEADRYLTENYGNWQVPEPNFDTFIDTPNMIVNEPVALAWFYLIRMYNHARKGNVTKYIAVWRAWQKLGNADLSLSSAVERFLRATETQCEAMLQATRNRAFNDVERIS